MAELHPESAKVALVIATFNGAQWMHALFESIQKSSCRFKVYIVDNNSHDATVKTIKEIGFPCTIVENRQNIGFGAACNKGIKRALNEGAEYVFLLNQDAKLTDDTVSKLVSVAQEHPQYALLSPIHLEYDSTELDPHIKGYLTNTSPDITSDLFQHRPREIYELPFMPAAGWLLRAEALRRVGGFDPLFFMYGEDMDLCCRLRRAGLQIGLVPAAAIHHWHGGPPGAPVSVKTRRTELYWQTVLWLKDPAAPFWKQSINVAREAVCRIFRKIVYLDFSGLKDEVWFLKNIVVRVVTIVRHRNLCAGESEAFLKC